MEKLRQRLSQLHNAAELTDILKDVKILNLEGSDDQKSDYRLLAQKATALTGKISEVHDVVDSELKTERIDLLNLIEAERVNAVRCRAEKFNAKRREMLDQIDFHRRLLTEGLQLRVLCDRVAEQGVDQDRKLLLRVATHGNKHINEQKKIRSHQDEIDSLGMMMNDLDEKYLLESTDSVVLNNEKIKKITRDNKRSRKYFSQLCQQIVEHLKEIVLLASQ